MTNLILPEYLAKKLAANPGDPIPTVEASTPETLTNAYVKAEERVLDPSKLPDSALERLPQPQGWRLLVLPFRGKNKKGEVYLPDEYVERMSLSTVVAYVLAVGPEAYKDPAKFTPNRPWWKLTGPKIKPWCKKGDWIILGRYAGARFRIEGGEVRIINDDEVIATIADPDDISNV